MYLLVLCIIILKLEPSKSQFPRHMDFQKVGDTIFNNEVYNILRPTTHMVSDYFTDYLLRRENLNFPTKRLFIDDNGFRHYWSGFDKKTKSLRKTEIISDVMETVELVAGKAKNWTKESNDNETRSATKKADPIDATTTTTITNKTNSKNIKSNDKNLTSSEDIEVPEKKDKSSKKNLGYLLGRLSHKKELKDSQVEVFLRDGATTKAPSTKKERNIVTTTFFCPFFGVITMSAFID